MSPSGDRDLRASNVEIFDLSGGDPQVYYELGIALALGTELVLLAQQGTALPFDVAQNVLEYATPEELDSLFAEAITGALYGLQTKGGGGDSVASTLAYAARLAGADSANPLLRVACQSLEKAAGDPVRFHAALKAFNGYLGAREHELLFPRWPVSYPGALEQRCFVVMPFRPELDRSYRRHRSCGRSSRGATCTRRRRRGPADHRVHLGRNLPGHPHYGGPHRAQPQRLSGTGHSPCAGTPGTARRARRHRTATPRGPPRRREVALPHLSRRSGRQA